MPKETGIGSKFLVGRVGSQAYDLSGDVGSFGGINLEAPTIDQSGIDADTNEMLPARLAGSMAYTAFFNPDTGHHNLVMRDFRAAAAQLGTYAAYLHRNAVGAPALFGKFMQLGFQEAQAVNGAITVPMTLSKGGAGPDDGDILWTGLDAAPAAHTGFDLGQAGTVKTITANTLANPTVVTSVAHGLTTGDTIFVSGSNSTPVINGDRTVTVLTADTFSVPVNVSVAGTAGTFYKTSRRFGIRLLVMLTALATGTMVPLLEDSADNSTWASVSNMTITGMTLADGVRYASVRASLIRRYIRVSSTGTFTGANWLAVAYRPASYYD